MKRQISKIALAAAVFALMAAAPSASFAQAAKKGAMSCSEGARCTSTCNSVKWCTVQVCTGGKWQKTMVGCMEPFCRNKKC